jgi:Protein of unknown function (DUF3592)
MSSDTKGRMLGLLILGILVVCLGSNIFSGIYQSLQSEHWPRAEATVTTSAVNRDGSDVATRWTPVVEYRYNVGNASFASKRVRFLMAPMYQREEATGITEAYGVGRAVSIAYNPANPADSVLEPGLPPGTTKQVLIAMFLFGLVGYIFYEIHHPERRILLRTFSDQVSSSEEPENTSEAA